MASDAAMIEKVKALLAALPAEDQAELHRYLGEIVVTPDEAEAIQVASLTDRSGGKTVTYTFRNEHVRCGKASCWCSEDGLGHGPYTYKYWKEGGKLRKEYVGAATPRVSRRSGRRSAVRPRGSIAENSTAPALPP